MAKINQIVREFLKYMEWNCEEPSESSCRFIVPGHSGRWVCVLRWEKDSFIGCYSTCSLNVPARRRAAAAEYLMRATYNLRIGNFEMDYEDGEVVFKTSAPLDGIEPSMEFVKALAFANYSIMDRYLPCLISVAFSKASPKTAVEEAEKPEFKQEEGDDDDSEEDPQAPRPRSVRLAQSGADTNVRQLTECDRREIRNRVPIPVGRGGRVAQITKLLKLMVKRTFEEAKDSCFAIISPAERVAPDKEVHRFIQFCFQEKWFAVDLPNTGILPSEAERVLRQRRGFYREAERPDAGVTSDVNDLVQFDPIGKKYIYGDEREAAEDAAYLLFDVYGLPLDAEMKLTAFASGDGPSWEKDQPLE